MVTIYDVISSRWSIHFWVKIHVFSTFFNKKSNTCGRNDAKKLCLCCFTYVKRQKWLILTVFTLFLILDKIQDGSQDGDHAWWRHRPPAAPPIRYSSSCREDQRLSTEGEIVSKCWNISKTQEGVPPTPPLYHGGGMTLRVRPRVNPLDYGFTILFRSSLKSYCDQSINRSTLLVHPIKKGFHIPITIKSNMNITNQR